MTSAVRNYRTKVVIQPSVILDVIEHYRDTGKLVNRKRVGGILLGFHYANNIIVVTNSFAVQFIECTDDEDSWEVNFRHVEKTKDLISGGIIKKNQQIVGWYHTGDKIHLNDILVNEQIRQYYSCETVLAMINIESDSYNCSIETFIASDHKINTKIITTFDAVECECVTQSFSQPNQTFLLNGMNNNHDLQSDHDDDNDSIDADAFNYPYGAQERIRQAYTHVINIRKYLRTVGHVYLPINNKILTVIQKIIMTLPQITLAEVQNATQYGVTQKILLESTSLIRSILAIHIIVNKYQTNQFRNELNDIHVSPEDIQNETKKLQESDENILKNLIEFESLIRELVLIEDLSPKEDVSVGAEDFCETCKKRQSFCSKSSPRRAMASEIDKNLLNYIDEKYCHDNSNDLEMPNKVENSLLHGLGGDEKSNVNPMNSAKVDGTKNKRKMLDSEIGGARSSAGMAKKKNTVNSNKKMRSKTCNSSGECESAARIGENAATAVMRDDNRAPNVRGADERRM